MTKKHRKPQQVIFFLALGLINKQPENFWWLRKLETCYDYDLQIQTAGNPGKESASRPPNLNTPVGDGGGVIYQMLSTAKGVYSPPNPGYLQEITAIQKWQLN